MSLQTVNDPTFARFVNPLHHARVLSGVPFAWPNLDDNPVVRTRLQIQQHYLDVGQVPDFVERVVVPVPENIRSALLDLLASLGLPPSLGLYELETAKYVVAARPLPEPFPLDPNQDYPITFVCCVSDEATLRGHLLASPDLHAPSPHQVILLERCETPADGLNEGLRQAAFPLVVAVHQDVYLPRGWCRRFAGELIRAELTLQRSEFREFSFPLPV